MLDDRRDACRALKALSKKYRVEVGAQGMDALRFILEMDKQDCEIVGYALDTLCNIMSKEVFEEEGNIREPSTVIKLCLCFEFISIIVPTSISQKVDQGTPRQIHNELDLKSYTIMPSFSYILTRGVH